MKLIAEPWDIGPGGYQVGNFPPQWTEWNGNYRDTVRDFWRGEPSLGEFASPARRAPPTSTSTPAGARSRASTSSPPTTASRCATWCPTTRSTTTPTARTTTTARATTARGTTASRARPTTPTILGLRARAAAQLPRHAAAQPGRADDPARRRARAAPRTATTTPTPRTPSSAWVHWDRRRQAAGRVHRGASPGCARDHPTFRRRRFFTGTTGAHRRRRAAQRHRLAAPRRPPDGATTTGTQRLAGDRDVPQRQRHRRARTPAAAPSSTTTSCSTSTPTAPTEVTLPPEEYAAGLGRRDRHRRVDADGRRPVRRARRSASRPAALIVLREHARARGGARPLRGRLASPRTGRPADSGAAPRGRRSDARRARRTACRSRRTSTCSRRRDACPTCTTSASTGSTCRRCSRPSRAATTGTTSSTTPRRPSRAAAPRGWPRCRPRPGGSGMGVLVDIVPNHVGRRDPGRERVVVGRAAARPRLGARRRVRRRLGGRRRPDPAAGARRRRPTDGRSRPAVPTDGELRYHDQRFPIAPGTPTTATAARACTPASTTSWSTGAGRRRA